jgi:transposase
LPPRRELVTNKAEFNPNFMSEKIYFGVDVCKESLAFCGANVAGQVPNNAPGVRRLLARLPQGAHLIIEASGGYERELVKVAQQSAVLLSVVNPRQVRDFARGVGRLAKTDPIDAEMLARFGAEVNPPPDAVPTTAELALQELVSARQQLVEQRTVLLQQQSQHLNNVVRRLDRARLKLLQRQIDQLQLAISSILEEQSALKQKVERLQQVKGVGFITAVTCVALCPELGSLSKRQTAALVGVAPYDEDSGARKGWRHISGGRPKLRRALYMASISAVRSNPILRRFYQQLRQRNKPPKVALVAVIRKLAILLNRLLRNASFLPAS